MAGRTRFFHRRIGELFPAESSLARLMWSLFAIRTDLEIEVRGIGTARDGAQPPFGTEFLSRTYFFRGSLRSLYSAHTQLCYLLTSDEFPEFEETARALGAWDELLNQFGRIMEFAIEFRRHRNAFGGHVERNVARALRRADPAEQVLISFNEETMWGTEIGEAAFACSIRDAAGAPHDVAAMEALMIRMRDATIAVGRCIVSVLNVYAQMTPRLAP